MQPGHEDCGHVSSGHPAAVDPRTLGQCLHEHKHRTVIGEDLCSPETVGWHCDCCGRVWIDQTYVEGARP